MAPLVSNNLSVIKAFCERFGVARLELFGSAAREDFDPDTSDIDFIVEFIDYGPGISDRYFGLIDALENLFGRPVDVGSARTLKNPHIIAAIAEDRTTLYEVGTAARLRDAIEAINEIEYCTANLTWSDFEAQQQTQMIVESLITTIGDEISKVAFR